MDITLRSGAKFHITSSSFKEVMPLQRALLKCAIGMQFNKELLDTDVGVLKDAVLSAATSDEVEAALFQCMRRATYNDVRVTPELFDDPKLGEMARQDFYIMAWEVIKVNCGPFFTQLLLNFREILGRTTAATQK